MTLINRLWTHAGSALLVCGLVATPAYGAAGASPFVERAPVALNEAQMHATRGGLVGAAIGIGIGAAATAGGYHYYHTRDISSSVSFGAFWGAQATLLVLPAGRVVGRAAGFKFNLRRGVEVARVGSGGAYAAEKVNELSRGGGGSGSSGGGSIGGGGGSSAGGGSGSSGATADADDKKQESGGDTKTK